MGSRSSTSSSNSTQDFTTNNVDNRVSEGDIGGNINLTLSDISTGSGGGGGLLSADAVAGVGGNEGVNVEITTSDFGALDTASELSDRAFQFAESATSNAISSNAQSVKDAINVAQSATQDEAARTQQFLILGGVVVAVAVAFLTLRGRK